MVEERVFRHRGSNSRSSRGFSRGDSRRVGVVGGPARLLGRLLVDGARETRLCRFFKDASLRFFGRSVARSPIRPVVPRDTRSRGRTRARSRRRRRRLAHSRICRSRRGRRNPREKSRDGGDARLTAPRDVPRRRGARFPTKSDARDGIQPRGGPMARERSSTTRRRATIRVGGGATRGGDDGRRRRRARPRRRERRPRVAHPRGVARGGRGDATGRARVDVPSPRGDPRSRRFGSRRRARRSTRIGREGDPREATGRRGRDAIRNRVEVHVAEGSERNECGSRDVRRGRRRGRARAESARRGFRTRVQIRIQIRTRRRRVR